MKRQFTPQEQLLIGLGALVVVLLIGYALITGITGGKFGAARRSLTKAEKNYKQAIELHQRYERLGRQIEERKVLIARQDPNFDLPTFIGKVEAALSPAFTHKSVTSPSHRVFAEKYTRTQVSYVFDSKKLGAIQKFLYEIEDPRNGIIITSVKIGTKDKARGKLFNMTIRFSVVAELNGPR